MPLQNNDHKQSEARNIAKPVEIDQTVIINHRKKEHDYKAHDNAYDLFIPKWFVGGGDGQNTDGT